jgi:ABC-type transport system involved in cytochrome c biogenesis permease subunit
MDLSLILLRIALLCYGLGFLIVLIPLLGGSRRAVMITPWMAGAGAIAHTGAMVALSLALKRCPVETLPEVLSALAWVSVLVYLAAWARYRLDVLHLIILPLVLVIMVVSKILPAEIVPLSEGLRPTARRFHLTAIVLGVSALFITFAASLIYIRVDRVLKAKRAPQFSLPLPALHRSDAIARLSLMWAFPLLTIGIITGAVYNAAETGTYWSWNSRETLSVIAWGILAVVVVARVGWGWRGRKAAILTILGFAAVFLRMLGIS